MMEVRKLSRPTDPSHDTVLVGGRVYDGIGGPSRHANVVVRHGRIADISAQPPSNGARVIDCAHQWVVPGLVEGHTHIFAGVSAVGASPEEAHLHRGVVAACDAGTVGASTFPAFQRHIVEPTRMRILSLLNVSVLGLIDFRFGELLNPDTLVPADAIATARAHPEVVRGFKIRLSTDVVGDRCLSLLDKAVALAEEAGLPLMVHIGETASPLSQILERLRPGDVVAHCYTGKENGILGDDGVLAEVEQARERGVLFDSAHGRSNLTFDVARRAIAKGFLPDILSSDTSARNWRGPVYDLVTSMSKILALGATMADVVPRATSAPAKLLGLIEEGYGTLQVGGPAHVTVLKETEETTLHDADGATLQAPRLEPTVVLFAGEAVEPAPWRGLDK